MKRLLFPLLLVSLLAAVSILLLPRSQAQGGFAWCDAASTIVCTDPAIAELEDPDDPDIIPPIGEGPVVVGANVLVNDADDLGKAQNEPYTALNPTDSNHLVAGANDYFRGASGDAKCGVYGSLDGGATWPNDRKSTLPLPTGWTAGGDPGLAFGPVVSTGEQRVYYSCLAITRDSLGNALFGTVFVVFSTDGGQTFPAGNLRVVAQGSSSVFNDKPFIAGDQSNSPHRGNVYVSWTRFDATTGTIRVARSVDNGATWGNLSTVSTATVNQGSVPFVGPDGTLYIAFARLNANTFRTNAMFIARSADGGVTWSSPITVATGITGLPVNPRGQTQLVNAKFRVNSFPTAVVDTSGNPATSGNLYIAWSAYRSSTSTNADIFVTRSNDSGLTWSAPQRLSAANDQFFPALSVDPSGNLDLVYYSRTNTTKARFNLKHRRSVDGALTFGAETQINDGGVLKAAQFKGEFIGDYIGVVSGPADVHPVWMETRRLKPNSNKVQQDIFTSAVTP